MRRFWNKVDFHLFPILLFLAPFGVVHCVGLLFVLLIPQGIILTRAFVGYPAFKRPPWAYLVANELLVLGVVGILLALQFAIAAIATH